MKTIALTAAVVAATIAVSATATPAFARAEGRFGSSTVTYNPKTDRYCFRETVTGSKVPAADCRSKNEWALNGLTIEHKTRVQIARR
ncbi:hypothetical protein U5A82_21115 [Sphingobium sp. CR2-8]|uniref:hypothetical protein n=1 Tax=Sphingobium sp. CR2-8 TaxID=1306534 RepID=UPI002DB8CD69|nr:hypothetical protein [Sphingobium sp. CR2-8]MEC3912880.1 hypothetical protein [Sphingobium sp. CR2-8]